MDKTVSEIVKEFFPEASDEAIEHIVWGHTGYPSFWSIPEDGNTAGECFRKQLQYFKENPNEEPLTGKLP